MRPKGLTASLPFSPDTKLLALLRSRRTCCVCHTFSGRDCVIHHIDPEVEDGPDTIANAIVLCPRCHGDAGHYNPNHPLGNKYSRAELRKHRDSWWAWCQEHPFDPVPSHPIQAFPTRVDLRRGAWTEQVPLEIWNRSSQCLYSVWVVIRFTDPGVTSKDLAFELPTAEPALRLRVRELEFSGDIFGLFGRWHDGTPMTALILYRLGPGEKRLITLRGLRNKDSTIDTVSAIVTVEAFDETPLGVVESPDCASILFTPPAGITIEGLIYHILKAPQQEPPWWSAVPGAYTVLFTGPSWLVEMPAGPGSND